MSAEKEFESTHKEKEIEIIKKIHYYLRGELTVTEADELWVEFLKDPKLFELCQIEAGIIHMLNNRSKSNA